MKKLLTLFFAAALFFFCACRDKKTVHADDTPQKGSIEISVDETFEPVIKEQIAEYEASYPGTHINAHYKSEADCLKDFFRDSSTRMIIVTRGLTLNEERFITDSLHYAAGWNEVASDAIAVLVNNKSKDTLFTLEGLRQQLTGKVRRDETIVFDGLNKTSTVRFIEDSVLKGEKFDTSVVRAVKTSRDVLEYVAAHENAIGFAGINHIGNPEDTAQVQMLKKLKIGYVECSLCAGKPYIFPSQESILDRRYPLVRGLYYIIKENYTGLGSGFTAFLKYERGQLIFRRAYLAPIMEFRVRDVKINEELPPN